MTDAHGHTHADAHTHGGADTDTDPDAPDEQFWDTLYQRSERIWSGNPNPAMVREVADLAPGRALDLGCGEGGDAIWLAGRGWQVTAVDVSRVALDRAAVHAAEAGAGIGERIEWRLHDLGSSFPDGSFDLVSAQFLYFRGQTSRERILRSAAAAVAPGGTLLIEGHSGFPSWEEHSHDSTELPTPEQVISSLSLPEGEWEVQVADKHERIQNAPDGTPTTRTDNTVKLRRLAAG